MDLEEVAGLEGKGWDGQGFKKERASVQNFEYYWGAASKLGYELLPTFHHLIKFI